MKSDYFLLTYNFGWLRNHYCTELEHTKDCLQNKLQLLMSKTYWKVEILVPLLLCSPHLFAAILGGNSLKQQPQLWSLLYRNCEEEVVMALRSMGLIPHSSWNFQFDSMSSRSASNVSVTAFWFLMYVRSSGSPFPTI